MEKIVTVNKLVKNFLVTQKKPGLFGSISSLFKPEKKLIKALCEISFSLSQGEMVGFIGPNGAGKTTTLKILSGLLYPSNGFVQVMGYEPWQRKPEFLKQISLIMGQKNQLWWDLPALDTFELNQAIYEIPRKRYRDALSELSKLLEVEDILNIQVRRLSLGQRMRLELIAALLHQPKILFLDEPTLGLDVVGQQKIREFIIDYNRRQSATIILTSHNMDDVLDIAKRVIVIDKGSIIFDGNLRELIENFASQKIIKLYFSKEADIKKLELVGKVKKIDFPQAIISVPRQAAAVAASELLQNFPIADLTIEEESIENVVRKLFKGEITKRAKSHASQ